MKPIKPNEVVAAKAVAMPDEVIQAFNGLIAELYIGHTASFTQDVAIDAVVEAFKKARKRVTRAQIFKHNWLDVEDIYRQAGWAVEYDSPGFNEDYEPSFTFSKRTKL